MEIFTRKEVELPGFEAGPGLELAGPGFFRYRAPLRHGGIGWWVYLQCIAGVVRR